MPPSYRMPLIGCQVVAKATVEARFDRSKTDFRFRAGQYVSITLPNLKQLELREQFRDFSISSAPDVRGYISVTFRVSGSIFKQHLLKMKPGELVEVEGPSGVFALPDGDVIMIAGGIGVTPFHSMLMDRTSQKHQGKLLLLSFNHEPSEAAYKDELAALPHVQVRQITGKVTNDTLKQYLTSPAASVLIAGPPPMVAITKKYVQGVGTANAKIMSEEFSGYDS